jgi:hypothetical protein
MKLKKIVELQGLDTPQACQTLKVLDYLHPCNFFVNVIHMLAHIQTWKCGTYITSQCLPLLNDPHC